MASETVTVVGASQPHPHETQNGDAWVVHWCGRACRIAVLDGLGHGPDAAAASQAAVQRLGQAPDAKPTEALQLCHRTLAGTRGAALSVVWIDTESNRLSYAGVGNVEGRIMQRASVERLTVYRGIVGAAMPRTREFHVDLSGEWLVLLHTDDVSARMSIDMPNHVPFDPLVLAQGILQHWKRETDDATVVIACPTIVTLDHMAPR
jgi:hypothetical protein